MKARLMVILAALVAAILLIPPAVSLNDMSVDDTITVHVEVEAYCASYYDWDATFSTTITQSQATKPPYWDYVGDYWGGGSLSIVPPAEYPYLQVLIERNLDVSTRMVDYQPYVYGETITWSGDYEVESGDLIAVQVQIYWAQSSGAYDREEYRVV